MKDGKRNIHIPAFVKEVRQMRTGQLVDDYQIRSQAQIQFKLFTLYSSCLRTTFTVEGTRLVTGTQVTQVRVTETTVGIVTTETRLSVYLEDSEKLHFTIS